MHPGCNVRNVRSARYDMRVLRGSWDTNTILSEVSFHYRIYWNLIVFLIFQRYLKQRCDKTNMRAIRENLRLPFRENNWNRHLWFGCTLPVKSCSRKPVEMQSARSHALNKTVWWFILARTRLSKKWRLGFVRGEGSAHGTFDLVSKKKIQFLVWKNIENCFIWREGGGLGAVFQRMKTKLHFPLLAYHARFEMYRTGCKNTRGFLLPPTLSNIGLYRLPYYSDSVLGEQPVDECFLVPVTGLGGRECHGRDIRWADLVPPDYKRVNCVTKLWTFTLCRLTFIIYDKMH